MTAFSGSTTVAAWVQANATTTWTGDQRSFSYTPSIGMYDQTAGADTHKSYIPGVKDGTWTMNVVIQAGTDSGGTVTLNTAAEGNIGTLFVYPEGITAGKTKYGYPSITQGVAMSWPYDNVCEATINGQQNGARTEGTSTGTAGA